MKAGSEPAAVASASLRDYVNVVRRRKWIVLQAVLLIPLAAFFLAVRKAPTYQASADVLLSRQNLAATLAGAPDPTAGLSSDQVVETQAQLARVPAIARATLVHAHVTDRSPGQFLGQSSVSAQANTDILRLAVTDTDPAIAARLATAYARQYTLYRRRLDTASLDTARKAIDRRLRVLRESGDTHGTVYDNLVEKEQELATMSALQGANAYVVRTATSAGKIGPRPFRDGLLGLLLGVGLGLGLAFLREGLDTRVRSAHEISEWVGLPLLGRIPAPPRRLRSAHRLVMTADPSGVGAEAFRMLRTSLDFTRLGRDVRTIMVTSSVEREGKTTTAANLAVAFARAGQQVVLVDLDLRRPAVHRFFDLANEFGERPGITQVVLGHAPLEDALVLVDLPAPQPAKRRRGVSPHGAAAPVDGKLLVLRAGPIPPDPGEFVATPQLAQVLTDLRERADIVIIDSPPLLHVGDALTLGARVDGVMLVTRLEAVRRQMLAEVRRALDNVPSLALGFAVTGAHEDESYSDGYYGSYPSHAGLEQVK